MITLEYVFSCTFIAPSITQTECEDVLILRNKINRVFVLSNGLHAVMLPITSRRAIYVSVVIPS
jgi:hypothetical protein